MDVRLYTFIIDEASAINKLEHDIGTETVAMAKIAQQAVCNCDAQIYDPCCIPNTEKLRSLLAEREARVYSLRKLLSRFGYYVHGNMRSTPKV